MVWRTISFSVAQKQLLVGFREQLGIKDTEFGSKVQLEILKKSSVVL